MVLVIGGHLLGDLLAIGFEGSRSLRAGSV
jgi:hypothetical protein